MATPVTPPPPPPRTSWWIEAQHGTREEFDHAAATKIRPRGLPMETITARDWVKLKATSFRGHK